MSDFKGRLVTEQEELQVKLQKLVEFIGTDGFNKIEGVQQALLKAQSSAMATYLTILTERLMWM